MQIYLPSDAVQLGLHVKSVGTSYLVDRLKSDPLSCMRAPEFLLFFQPEISKHDERRPYHSCCRSIFRKSSRLVCLHYNYWLNWAAFP